MARKIRGFERVLDSPALFSVAYGEIASSLYFALGIVAAYALGLTPYVLLGAGAFFLLVALSYAEGTAAIPETGGAATFVRRAFNDLLGFLTGWALFLDYLIVIALSTLFLPHYLGAALDWPGLRRFSVGRRHRRRPSSPRSPGSAWHGVRGSTRPGIVVAGARPRDPAPARRARACAALLARRADVGHFARNRAELGRPRLRSAARATRLHRTRDGREPGRGDAPTRADAAAQPLLGDRARRRDHRVDRGRRAFRLPGRKRANSARRRVAAGSDRRHRRRPRRPAARMGSPVGLRRLRRAHRAPSSCSLRRRPRSRASRGSRTASAVTVSFRTRSGA